MFGIPLSYILIGVAIAAVVVGVIQYKKGGWPFKPATPTK
jgi:hypothetical protein